MIGMFSPKQRQFFQNLPLDKPESHPQNARIQSTVVPDNMPMKNWMDGKWGTFAHTKAQYRLLRDLR